MISWFFKFLERILVAENKGIKGLISRVVRIIIGSVKKFLDDEGMQRATAISYSVVVLK